MQKQYYSLVGKTGLIRPSNVHLKDYSFEIFNRNFGNKLRTNSQMVYLVLSQA